MAESPLPPARSRLDRAALERVLARATDLQSRSGDPADGLTDDQILDLGKEVGLSGPYLRQALAEERAGFGQPEQPRGMFGSSNVNAERTVPGTPAEVLAALDTWVQREELLRIKRRFPDRIIWEPQRGLEATVRRAFNVGGRAYALSRATDVSGTIVPTDESHVLVRVEAALTGYRRGLVRQTMAAGTLGALGTGVALAVHVAAWFAAAPVVVMAGAGYFIARELHANAVSRAQLTLEQLLDRLERGERPQTPSLLNLIAAATSGQPKR
jgi:hypothetical protein